MLSICEVAERQFLGAETAKNRIEQNSSGHDQVRTSRVEPGNGEPMPEILLCDLLSNPPDLLDGDVQIAQIRWGTPTSGGRSHRADAENGSRRPDDAVETGRDDLVAIAIDFAQDMFDDLPLVAFCQRIAAHEPLGQSNCSNLEAARQVHRGGCPERNLDAAAADVDHDGASAADIDAIDGRLMNQARLFDT